MANPNPNPKYQFKKGNKIASQNKGKKQKRTILKEKLGLDNIEDLKEDVIKVWQELITSKDKKLKGFAAKEISKYIFSQKREHTGEFNEKVEVKIIYSDDKKA